MKALSLIPSLGEGRNNAKSNSKHRSMRIAVIATLIVLNVTQPSFAEEPAPIIHGASAPVVDYALLGSLPDWRGIWTPDFSPLGTAREEPPLKGEYLKRYKESRANPGAPATKSSNCAVPGMPMVMQMPYDIEILFNPGRVTIIQEAYMQVRRVYTDGRALPQDPDPTFNGSSIGHWEEGTLVIETVGIRPDVPLTIGATHSDALKITERIHLSVDDADKLLVEMTFEDKKALRKPWHQTLSYTRHREWDQLEFICNENDRNPIGPDGKTEYILRDQAPVN